ncbi:MULTISPECIES: hypothetical protein [unclassified Moorena]|nr:MULTISPECIES: hypothetical protein [unclassified Moorena]NEP35923.1 hypothetical protein [Moorena sp. SIO3B2]NET69190.1 hypothetical protein [Moorena sp. SIO1G6]
MANLIRQRKAHRGNRELGVGSGQKREIGRSFPGIIVYFDTYGEKFIQS